MNTLVPLTDYKAYVGINNANDDPKIRMTLAFVSALVEDYCGRSFLTATKKEQASATSGSIFLKNTPIQSVTTVTCINTSKETITVDPIDYAIYNEEGMVELIEEDAISAADLYKPYTVTYVAGYDTLPAPLVLAIMELTTYHVKKQYITKTSSVNVNIASEDNMTGSTDLPPHIKRVLDLYRAI